MWAGNMIISPVDVRILYNTNRSLVAFIMCSNTMLCWSKTKMCCNYFLISGATCCH